jgi:hypothetical protein
MREVFLRSMDLESHDHVYPLLAENRTKKEYWKRSIVFRSMQQRRIGYVHFIIELV